MPYQTSNAPSSINAPLTHLQKAMLKKNAKPTHPIFSFTSFPSWPWTSEGPLGRKDNVEGFRNSHGHGERKTKFHQRRSQHEALITFHSLNYILKIFSHAAEARLKNNFKLRSLHHQMGAKLNWDYILTQGNVAEKTRRKHKLTNFSFASLRIRVESENEMRWEAKQEWLNLPYKIEGQLWPLKKEGRMPKAALAWQLWTKLQ